MLGPLRVFLLILCTSLALALQGQSGIRAILANLEPVYADLGLVPSHYGLGFDRDLNDRLSMGIAARMSIGSESVVLDYRSAYHFADNEGSSFYLGPTLGVRILMMSDQGPLIPVGFRMGVRGGLENFYADIYAGAIYNIGASSSRSTEAGNNALDLRTGTFCLGLDLGLGWVKRKSTQ